MSKKRQQMQRPAPPRLERAFQLVKGMSNDEVFATIKLLADRLGVRLWTEQEVRAEIQAALNEYSEQLRARQQVANDPIFKAVSRYMDIKAS